MYYIGVDLGTSAVKLLLLEAGTVRKTVTRSYPLSLPREGWSEQNPEDWWRETAAGIRELVQDIDREKVAGISFGGQMHGLVALDGSDRVIRPAILWNDGRTEAKTRYLNEQVGTEKLLAETGNIAFAGFTAPKILWMRREEPEHFRRIARILLPKDYLSYRMTGIAATDYSDASGTLLLDVKHKRWSREMVELCGLSPEALPELYESFQTVGRLTPRAAEELGLTTQVQVAAGAGDNAAAAVGTGVVGEGGCNISLGTSGTVFISSRTFRMEPRGVLHAFAHADGGYHLMGCMLSAAICNQWWMRDILGTEQFEEEQKAVGSLGENPVYFLPYLMGERSPHNDPKARGVFFGLSLETSRGQMTQAVLEGVAYGLRDSLELARVQVTRSRLCGGGAKSRLWRRILANVLQLSLEIPEAEEGPALGAAMLAAVACGEYGSVQEAAEAVVRVRECLDPEPKLTELYQHGYEQFRRLYPAMKELFVSR